MSKLPREHKFIDLSDYGRPIARLIANSLKGTSYTPIDVTIWFIISGLIAIVSASVSAGTDPETEVAKDSLGGYRIPRNG